MMNKNGVLRMASMAFYVIGALASLMLMTMFFNVNRHLPWTWRPDALAQSFAGMAILFSSVLFLQFRSSSFLFFPLGQIFVAGILFLLCWLTHADLLQSTLFGAVHLIAVIAFAALNIRKRMR